MRIGKVSINDTAKGTLNLVDADSIYEIALKPIERGGLVSGWARFEIPGSQAREDMNAGKSEMRIHFYDVLDTPYEIYYKSSGGDKPPLYVPGTKNLEVVSKGTEFLP
jgi:hypothetical protein